jgi:N-acetylmuramoyl-L-alanine amidase
MRFTKYVLALSLLAGSLFATGQVAHAASSAVIISQGEKSAQVKDIQLRLRQLGFYNKPINEVYDTYTRNQVVRFQTKYHVRVDGIVGPETRGKLHQVTVTQTELLLLAKAVYSESRGEKFQGKVAVAAVILNRVDTKGFPDTIKGVIYQPGAFTAVSDGQFALTPDQDAYKAVYQAIRGVDQTKGAIYYFNPKTASSSWMKQRAKSKKTVAIGQHVFMK